MAASGRHDDLDLGRLRLMASRTLGISALQAARIGTYRGQRGLGAIVDRRTAPGALATKRRPSLPFRDDPADAAGIAHKRHRRRPSNSQPSTSPLANATATGASRVSRLRRRSAAGPDGRGRMGPARGKLVTSPAVDPGPRVASNCSAHLGRALLSLPRPPARGRRASASYSTGTNETGQIKCHAGLSGISGISGIRWDRRRPSWMTMATATRTVAHAHRVARRGRWGRARAWKNGSCARHIVPRSPVGSRAPSFPCLHLSRPVFSRVSGRDPDAESAPGAPHHGPGRACLRGHARFKQSRARPQGRARGTYGRGRPH